MSHTDQPVLQNIPASIEVQGDITPIEIEVLPGYYRFSYQNMLLVVDRMDGLWDEFQDDLQLECTLRFLITFPARLGGQLVFRECLITITTDGDANFSTLRLQRGGWDSGEHRWTFEEDYQRMYQSVFQDGTPESCITCRWAVDNPYGAGQGLRCMVRLKDQPVVLHTLRERYKGLTRLEVFQASPQVRENFWCDQHQRGKSPFMPNQNP